MTGSCACLRLSPYPILGGFAGLLVGSVPCAFFPNDLSAFVAIAVTFKYISAPVCSCLLYANRTN